MTTITLLCGVLSTLSLGHSISANDASIKDYPYFASLSNCGAGILSDRWIVTAAHCVVPMPSYPGNLVWVGGERLNNSKELQYDRFIVHPKYIQKPIKINDIALLRLVTPLTFNDEVKPLKLPTDTSMRNPYVSFVGRGLDETNHEPIAIKSVDLTRLTGEQCLSYMPQSEQKDIRPHLRLLEKAIVCTKRSDDLPGICIGDSGGPLAQDDTLIGLASFVSKNNCHETRLGFFTNVATYVPWIKKHTGL